MEPKKQQIYSLHNEDLKISLKMISKVIEKTENQLRTKDLSTSEVTKEGTIKRVPNMMLTTVKKATESIKELKNLREEIKRKYKISKIETVLLDLESIKKELADKDLRQHLSSVAGITNERPSLKKVIHFEQKLKNKDSSEKENNNPFKF